ncbi:uncharacterized protein LOC131681156 [Topomyia yanbarensis]|uniref:uncharacterized protein LOC131681156 n=1 Tax=Topomyia yanbarensis TaxID=2498891 RepID=UPI00273BDFA6|nr:uncharacterized protein LOC131681156 [Topomyia yanbarensis]
METRPNCNDDLNAMNRMELHIFVDASEEAYAAVAYFRIVPPDGDIKVALVAAKTKVAPLKPMSIPRLELQAAVLGIRLMKFILESHPVKIARRVLHSDSSTFLSWIRCDPRRYKQYVALRVAEVLSESEVDEWRWVPSKMNPADIATKWGHGPPLDPDHEWYRGYKFMKLPETTWPPQRVAIPITEEEIRSCYTHHGISIPTPVVNFNRFSRWPTLLRGLAYVFRYVSNLHRRIKKQDTTAGYLTQEELRKAETHLIRMTQWEVYSDEMVTLHGNQHLSPERRQPLEKNSKLNKLTPVLDENGILRVDSRLNTAKNIAMQTNFPIILPKKHPLAYLIVDHFHRQYRHANSETVVNEVRQLYNIPQLRPLVKNVARNCQECKIAKSMPRIPRMAPLPNARLALFTRPFTYVGVDLFGPLLVKLGRSNVKRWVALYTCLTTRAVHVEVVYNLSTEAFVMSMRRFVARRGSPVEVYSDNGTNFQGANRLLQEQIQKIAEGMAATFTNTTTRWVFNPPGAPHMGGSWERLMRSIKVAMAAVNSSGRKLDDEGLLTLIVEAESIVNSRPLTYMPLDSEEQEAITPNHFLLGSSNGVRQPRWVREFLPTLTRRTKWFGDVKPIKVGDLVFVVDGTRRNGWIRGRVQEVHAGKDGRIRKAIVQTRSGLMRRSVSNLAVLDVRKDSKTGSGTAGDQYYGEETVTNRVHCPGQREAPQGFAKRPSMTAANSIHRDENNLER